MLVHQHQNTTYAGIITCIMLVMLGAHPRCSFFSRDRASIFRTVQWLSVLSFPHSKLYKVCICSHPCWSLLASLSHLCGSLEVFLAQHVCGPWQWPFLWSPGHPGSFGTSTSLEVQYRWLPLGAEGCTVFLISIAVQLQHTAKVFLQIILSRNISKRPYSAAFAPSSQWWRLS